MRVSLPPNESCSFIEDVVIYSRPFGISLKDLLVPDLSYSHSKTKYEVAFASMEHSFAKSGYADVSNLQQLLVEPTKQKLALAFILHQERNAFRLGLAAVTWYGQQLLV